MSARRPARPDLALTEVRSTYTPAPGDRVRRDDHTGPGQLRHGTAEVVHLDTRSGRVAVHLDPSERVFRESWDQVVTWPLERVRLVSSATDRSAAEAPVHEIAAPAHKTA